jgi:hypothetical protein
MTQSPHTPRPAAAAPAAPGAPSRPAARRRLFDDNAPAPASPVMLRAPVSARLAAMRAACRALFVDPAHPPAHNSDDDMDIDE